MSRYRKKNNISGFIVFLGILVLGIIIQIVKIIIDFIGENLQIILIILGTLVFLFLVYIFLKIQYKIKKKKNYLNTPYYKETLLPYKIINNSDGLYFEMIVFNELSIHFPNSIVKTNLLIPRLGSINEYSEIDILFIHNTGLYVLELKNYSGYVYGNLKNEHWDIGYKRDNKRSVFSIYNPVLQNKKHIEDLSERTGREYINHVIFSNNSELDSNIENVTYLDEFINIVKTNQAIYTSVELEEALNEILKINMYEKIENHIERIKFNEHKIKKNR